MAAPETDLDTVEYEKFRKLWLDDLAARCMDEILKAYKAGSVEMSPEEACMILYRAFIHLSKELATVGQTNEVSIKVAVKKMNKEMGW